MLVGKCGPVGELADDERARTISIPELAHAYSCEAHHDVFHHFSRILRIPLISERPPERGSSHIPCVRARNGSEALGFQERAYIQLTDIGD
jgi:hypothetical protein